MYIHFALQNSKSVICPYSNMHATVILSDKDYYEVRYCKALTSVQAMMLHDIYKDKGMEKNLETEK